MLTQWRYKIVERFAIVNGEIVSGKVSSKLVHIKPRPKGLFLYKPSTRKYDYVDYTGSVKGQETEVTDRTCTLEILGYIKFISSRNCGEDDFA